MPGFVHGLGHQVQVSTPGQADQAISQVLPLQQHKECEDDHQEHRNQRSKNAMNGIEPVGLAYFLHRDWVIGRGAQLFPLVL